MRVLLMLSGAVLAAGALVFWIWLNQMAGAYNLSQSYPPMTWLSEDAVYYLWLPVAAGAAIALIGWRWR